MVEKGDTLGSFASPVRGAAACGGSKPSTRHSSFTVGGGL